MIDFEYAYLRNRQVERSDVKTVDVSSVLGANDFEKCHARHAIREVKLSMAVEKRCDFLIKGFTDAEELPWLPIDRVFERVAFRLNLMILDETRHAVDNETDLGREIKQAFLGLQNHIR